MKICPRCSEAYPDETTFCVVDATPLKKVLDPLLGKTVAQRYRLISRLGVGGMSSVYLARHVMIDRLSAIKILRSDLGQDTRYRDRFLREARAVNRINHENIVEITDYGESNGLVYLVMEYIPGESLQKMMARGPISWRRMVPIAVQVASALGRAHQMGVIHRDLKPENLLLVKRKDGFELVKLTDFGIAKIIDAPSLTVNEQVMGTPGYMAPEYVESGRIDARGDLWALGVVLYEAITGKLPYEAKGQAELLVKTVSEPPTPIGRWTSELPEALVGSIMQMLSPKPEDRQRDAFVVHDELLALVSDPGLAASRSPLTAVPVTRPGDDPEPELPPPLVSPRPARVVPDMQARPFSDLAPLCRAGLARIDAALPRFQSLASGTLLSLSEARRLVEAVSAAGEKIGEDQARIAAMEAQGREFKQNFGRALDELGRDASRANGWVQQIDKRREELEWQRADNAPGQADGLGDVLLWEQAALEEEDLRARTAAKDLAFQLETLRAQLSRHNETFDDKIEPLRAELEGHVAALRTLAAETWSMIDEAALALGVQAMPSEPPPKPS